MHKKVRGLEIKHEKWLMLITVKESLKKDKMILNENLLQPSRTSHIPLLSSALQFSARLGIFRKIYLRQIDIQQAAKQTTASTEASLKKGEHVVTNVRSNGVCMLFC